jgi:gliding motility-associated-like protein
MVVNITPAPVVNGGPANQFVCKNNPNYQLNATSSTGSASWTTSGTGTFSPNSTVLNPVYFSSTADTTSGSVMLTLTSTNNGGCLSVTQTINLIYTQTLTVNPGITQTVCANNATVALNGISTTSAGIWTSSGNGTFTPSSGSLSTSYIPSASDILAGAVTLTLTSANNGGCNPVTNTTSIIITPKPTANAGPDQSVCANNASISLSGSVTIASGGIWSSSGTGTFSPNNTSLNTGYIASPADTTAGSVFLILSTTGNGNCLTVSDTMVLNFTPAPLVNAGANASACKTNPNISLNGTSSTGSATWTTLGSGTFNPNNTVLNPTYVPSTADTSAGSVLLILTSTNNGGCNAVSDTILLQYGAPPTVTAGASQTVCANNANVILNGTSSTGSGTWTSSGSGAFSPNSINGTYVPSSSDITSGSITLTLSTTNNLGCLPVTQQMNVNFTPAPTASAGASQSVCASAPTVSVSGAVGLATGGVWSSNGTGTFVPNNTSLNTSYVASSADTTAGSVTLYLTTTGNGNCNPVVDSLVITFISSPFVSAGSDITMCDNVASVNLGGVSSVGTATWSTLGTGIFSPNNTVLNPTYSPSAADTAAGSVQLVLTYTNTGGCNAVNDTLKINFHVSPNADFTYKPVCFGTATSYTDISAPGSGTIISWSWNFGNDTSMMKDPVKTFTSSGSHTVSLLVNNGNCVDSITKTVWVNPLPVANYSATPAACGYTATFSDLSTVNPGGISGWSWDFGDLNTSNIQNPVHVYADTGSYVVTFTITSDSGCTAMFSDTVRVIKCTDVVEVGGIGEPAVPTGFTPNGDGNNDKLFVKGGPYSNLDFRIFNEWGQEIFRSTIQSEGWDGTYKSREQPVGAFVWTVDGELIDGRKVKMAGEVLLTR